MRIIPAIVPLGCALALLAACGGEVDSDAGNTAAAPPPGPTSTLQQAEPVELPDFNTRATIRDVMNILIDAHADILWGSVRYVTTAEGVEEYEPETDEEWALLRASAISMIEGANALMIPGRDVAPRGATTPYPDYEYLPAEVENRLEEDWRSWLGFAQGLQGSVEQALDAIEARDVDALVAAGEIINLACESCHEQYWYRAP